MKRSDELLTPERVPELYKFNIYAFSHAIITAGFSFIVPPPVGPILASIFGAIAFNQTINQNMNQLLIDIILDLKELQRRDLIDIDQLFNDPTFASHLLYAIQIAMRNHQREHHKALRNAIVNSALTNPPEEDMMKMFFTFIDSFTTIHFKFLRFFMEAAKSNEWIDDLCENFRYELSFHRETGEFCSLEDEDAIRTMSFQMWEVIKFEFPDALEMEPLYNQVMKDLHSKGMLNIDPELGVIDVRVNELGVIDPQLQSLGKLFMEFIISPLDDE